MKFLNTIKKKISFWYKIIISKITKRDLILTNEEKINRITNGTFNICIILTNNQMLTISGEKKENYIQLWGWIGIEEILIKAQRLCFIRGIDTDKHIDIFGDYLGVKIYKETDFKKLLELIPMISGDVIDIRYDKQKYAQEI